MKETSQARFNLYFDVSNEVTWRAPLTPLIRECQHSATLVPVAVINPSPVTTIFIGATKDLEPVNFRAQISKSVFQILLRSRTNPGNSGSPDMIVRSSN